LGHIREHSRAAFGFVLDTGHANLAGDLTEIVEHIGDRLISLHLNDNDGQNDRHLPPGDGSVDWKCVAQLLATLRYTGCVLHELMPNGREPRDLLRTAMERHRKFFGDFA
jgi:sugar phosphate isomerase/epimerase